jgi:hypothetical protein
MWSFFSRDSTKDFPYEIVENIAGKLSSMDENQFAGDFPIFLSFAGVLNDKSDPSRLHLF